MEFVEPSEEVSEIKPVVAMQAAFVRLGGIFLRDEELPGMYVRPMGIL